MKRVYVLDKTTLGSGTSPPLFSWQPVFSNYLAVVGAASYALRILDRQGGVVDVINLTSNCSVLRWSPDGNMLAICQSQASTILVWNVKDQTEQMIESSFKIFTCLAWSASSDMIAAGTSKGNLLLATLGGKTIPVLGKHTKSIEHVIWTKQNQIITVSEDKTWVVSNMEGDSIAQFGLKGQPSSPTLYQDKDQKHVFLCLIDKKSIYIHWIHSSSTTPNLLTLPPKYGEVLAIHPIESQQALFLVCTNGLISLISLDPQKLGQELAFSKVFKAGISATSFMNPLAAFTNEGHIKTLDVTDLREVVHKFDVVDTPNVQVDSIAWSADTRFLTMVLSGEVITYVSSTSTLAACNGEVTAYVTGLTEVTVGNEILTVPSEPFHMSINLTHLAIGFQHEVQIYTLNPLKQTLVIPCNNGIQQLCMSAQVVCVLTGQNLKSYSFTENDTVGTHIENVTLIGYYDAFVVTVFGDTVTYYTAPYNSTSIHASIPLKLPITQWFQSPICASAILISESQCFLCNPARDHVFPIPCKALNFLWDAFHPNLFYAYTSDTLFCFAYLPYTLTGAPTVQLVCQINLPLGWIPLYATEGQATCIFEQKVHVFPLFDAQNLSHLYYLNLHTTLFQKLLATSMQKESTSEMIEEALKALDLSFVRDAFMFSGDLANAAYFKLCAYDEELNIRRGHVLKWYQDFSGAQEMYLNSSQPIYALHLRKDLLQWEQALALASKMAVDEEPKVCEAYAKQLESDGRYSDALIMYQKALGINTHLPTSKNGVAKMKLRMGDFKVVQWIIDQDEPQVCLESAIILEELKEYMNAGMLYEKGKDFEKAAENFLLAQNWSKLDNLLPQVKNLKIYNTYGQYLESQKLFDKALRCYEKGNNALGMTKVYLAMSRIDEALKVARESKSQDAAKLVAQFLVQLGDLNTVLEFYLLAGLHQQAWQLAKEHNLVQQYIDFLGTSASKDQFLEAAVYYETTSPLLAGQYYLRAEAYETALSRFLNHPEGIEGAIETVGKAKKDHLTHALINYLMELKGAEKPRYIFQLYMKLGQFREAMRTALGIARDEWNIGNYRSARDILFETLIQLRNAKQRVSGQLIRMLFLLHSYMLVKPLIKLEEHNNCARMLSRVSKSISRFQTHVIPILTSTVIECSKAGLLHIAYEFSVQLMRPEYRSQIDVKYKKRIENIVRNHVESETPNFEPTSPCPHCQSPLPNTETECNQCQNTIPFCIASGYHMTIENWSQCPNCLFPALLPSLRKFSEAGLGCPLCGEVIPLEKLKLVDNPQLSLSSWKYDEDTTEPSQQPTTALTKDAKG